MSEKAVTVMFAVVIIMGGCTGLPLGGEIKDSTKYDPDHVSQSEIPNLTLSEIEDAIADQINEVRTSHSLVELDSGNEALLYLARNHSSNMMQFDSISHSIPEMGRGFNDRLDRLGQRCIEGHENLAQVYWGSLPQGGAGIYNASMMADMVVDGWMSSQPHRENLLEKNLNEQVIGVYATNESVYVTQIACV